MYKKAEGKKPDKLQRNQFSQLGVGWLTVAWHFIQGV